MHHSRTAPSLSVSSELTHSLSFPPFLLSSILPFSNPPQHLNTPTCDNEPRPCPPCLAWWWGWRDGSTLSSSKLYSRDCSKHCSERQCPCSGSVERLAVSFHYIKHCKSLFRGRGRRLGTAGCVVRATAHVCGLGLVLRMKQWPCMCFYCVGLREMECGRGIQGFFKHSLVHSLRCSQHTSNTFAPRPTFPIRQVSGSPLNTGAEEDFAGSQGLRK